jgi:hypothetical protein
MPRNNARAAVTFFCCSLSEDCVFVGDGKTRAERRCLAHDAVYANNHAPHPTTRSVRAIDGRNRIDPRVPPLRAKIATAAFESLSAFRD